MGMFSRFKEILQTRRLRGLILGLATLASAMTANASQVKERLNSDSLKARQKVEMQVGLLYSEQETEAADEQLAILGELGAEVRAVERSASLLKVARQEVDKGNYSKAIIMLNKAGTIVGEYLKVVDDSEIDDKKTKDIMIDFGESVSRKIVNLSLAINKLQK